MNRTKAEYVCMELYGYAHRNSLPYPEGWKKFGELWREFNCGVELARARNPGYSGRIESRVIHANGPR